MPVTKKQWVNISMAMGHFDEEIERVFLNEKPKYNFDTGQYSYSNMVLHVTKMMPHRVMCKRCAKSQIIKCKRCNNDTAKIRLVRTLWKGDLHWLCPQCKEDLVIIKRYDYTIKPKFTVIKHEPVKKNNLYYGTEVEVEYPVNSTEETPISEIGQQVLDWWGNNEIYLKRDGSLENGFEVVTHPFSWSYYKKNVNKWSDFLMYMQTIGLTADYPRDEDPNNRSTCGLHIHMSKDAFTYMHLYKFVDFFYKRSSRFLIHNIAQRDSIHFARFNRQDYERLVKLSKEKKNVSSSRYSAINLMGGCGLDYGNHPAKTVEARVFKATLEPFIFHKNFEFLNSLYEFTATHTPKEMRVKAYLEYLFNKKKTYKLLYNFIVNSEQLKTAYNCIRPLMRGV